MTGEDHQDDPALAGAGLPGDGLSWSWELDVEALLAAVADAAPWERGHAVPAPVDAAARAPEDPDAELAEYLEAVEAGRSRVVPLEVVAGRVAESAPAGAGLAGWLAAGSVTGLEDGALAGMATSYRRLASWAQAGELSVVAELASRSAAADDRIGVDKQGRPARLPDDARAEVSLALTMSQAAASWWTDLGVTLRWRLAATGAALRSGAIDLGRARAIAEATASLDEETARAVEARMLSGAGDKTLAGLRAALRRAVIAADPHGAERRREEAERQAKVVLYPETEGTASLAGYSLPGVQAAAAMARICALARALKASGAGGGADLLRSQVFLGLLLGTLPYISPPDGAPPDQEPPDDTPPDEDDNPSDGGLPDGGLPADDESQEDRRCGDCRPSGGATPAGHQGRDDDRTDRAGRRDDGSGQHHDPGQHGDHGDQRDDFDDHGARPPPAWPDVPPLLRPGPAAMGNLRPAGGRLLDLRLPWATLTGQSPEPGTLGRLGSITPAQARYLADRAASDPTARWRVIVTDPGGRAVAVTHLTAQKAQPQAQPQAGLVGQVTVIIGQDSLPGSGPGQTDRLPPILARVLAAAQAAAAQAASDGQAAGGCAHAEATPAYRPTRRLWEYVTARDLTCRFSTCRRPATQCDLDHTMPFDQGGCTCSCNLGGVCRFHHKIKQHSRWRLDQPTPGTFIWTTPTGRAYTVQPDSYAA